MDAIVLSNAVIARVSGDALCAPAPTPADVAGAAEALVAESLRVPAQWDVSTPQGARAVVKGTMRRRHAELTEEALEALAAHYLRSWRGVVSA